MGIEFTSGMQSGPEVSDNPYEIKASGKGEKKMMDKKGEQAQQLISSQIFEHIT